MNSLELTEASRLLILSTGYNNTGFIGGFITILNQLFYAERLGLIPVVFFDPWSNDFPDFNRQELFENNHWKDYFESVVRYSYEDILHFISDPDHPLTKRNLHYLTNEEILYLNFGNPKAIYSGYYGYYRYHEEGRQEWLVLQRNRARALMDRYIQVRSELVQKAVIDIEQLSQGAPILGVIIDCFDRSDVHKLLESCLSDYFKFTDEYIKDNPRCKILLFSENEKYTKRLNERYGARLRLPDSGRHNKFSRFSQWLILSKCDFFLKDHYDLGELVLYLNPGLAFKDIAGSARPQLFRKFRVESKLFRKRWIHDVENEGPSLKVLARLLILANPITQTIMKSVEKNRFSKHAVLRWIVLFVDLMKLKRAKTYYPFTVIKHRAVHAANNINSEFYNFERAKKKKYFEIRNAWDTNTGFFAYFMMALTQLKFPEIHGMIPIVYFNEPHNHYYEPGYAKNIWENYFEPVTDLSSRNLQILTREEVTFIDHKYHDRLGNGGDLPETDELDLKIWLETHRAMKSAITKKYITPKSFIMDLVDNFYNKFMKSHIVLGIHIRGTGKSVDQKGKRYVAQEKLVRKILPDEYFPYVDKYLCVHVKAKLFVATDQKQYLASFIERYVDRIITSSALRTQGDEPLFRIKDENKFQIGVEVMCDSLLLSRCDYLIKGWSNVSEAAICFNPQIPVIDVMNLPDISSINFDVSQPAVSDALLQFHENLLN